jgi:diguanylate cyclase (GGDEF)-like protein/PAS domain S-box-containing protein
LSDKLKAQGLLRKAAKARPVRVPKPKPKTGPVKEQLRQSKMELEKFRDHHIDFYDFAPVGYLTLTEKGLISEINLTGAAMLGPGRSQLLKKSLSHFVASEDGERMHQHFLQALKQDEKMTCEVLFKRSDGSDLYAQLDCLRLLKKGHAPVVRMAMTDITERKKTEEKVRDQEVFFRMITENIDDFIAVLDLQGKRLYNSPSYARLFDNISSMKGVDSFAEIHPDDRERIKRIFNQTVQSGVGLRTEFRFVLADGTIRHMESRGGLVRNSRGQSLHVVVVSRDITERKLTEEKNHNLAFHDTLTKLPNRRLLNDRLFQTMAASKRSGRHAALIFIDLDNFKPLNDQHGHAIGDLLLEEVAHRISDCMREVDTVSRYGGDEFVVLFNELDTDRAKSATEAGVVAEKIRIALAEPYVLTLRRQGLAKTVVEHRCSASIGVVVFVDHEMSQDDIMTSADMAMYQAKQDGRNLIRFFDSDVSKR